MDFFEVLIILVFIVIPILEGVLKQRRKGKEAPQQAPAPRERERVGAGAEARGGAPRPPHPADEGPAADMIPTDLWEVLTGERRTQAPAPEPTWEAEGWEALPGAEEPPPEIAAGEVWESAPWEAEEWQEAEVRPAPGEPVSLEYVGPEAISLEGPPPPPEVRHRLFHDRYDPGPAFEHAPESAHGLRAALHGRELRRAVILAEILGPPKGLA